MSYEPNPHAPGYWRYAGLPIHADVQSHQLTVQLLRAQLAHGAKVLDVAAGQGALSKSLLDQGFQLSCTSWNDKAKVDIPTYRIDLDQPFDPSSLDGGVFDAACAIEIIEHLENPAQFLRSLAQVVRPGGWIVVSTPNVESAQARLEWLFNGFPYAFSRDEVYQNRHISMMWRHGLEAMMAMAGFDLVERHLVGTYRYASALQKLLKGPVVALIEALARGDTRGTTRLYLARRSVRRPKGLGADEVA